MDPAADSASSCDCPVKLQLPHRYAHWSSWIHAEIRQLLADFHVDAQRRWQRTPNPDDLELLVPVDDQAAVQLYGVLGLSGDPRVPRTFPDLRLAVVPLPRDEGLVAERASPPKTWMHTLRHEVIHLASADYPELRAAPAWFQEGLAEAWCSGELLTPGTPDSWPHWQHVALYATASTVSGESAEQRYSADALRVARLLATVDRPAPWEQEVVSTDRMTESSLLVGLRGRHADWDLSNGTFLLTTRPGDQADLDLPAAWDGRTPFRATLRTGRAPSASEAGLLLYPAGQSPAGSTRLRLRFGQFGGFAAYLDSPQAPKRESLTPSTSTRPGDPVELSLSLEDGTLHIRCGDLHRAIPNASRRLHWPLQIRMTVRDGSLELQSHEGLP